MSTSVFETMDAHWASFYGCTVADFQKPGLVIVPHAALGQYNGAVLFRRGPALIVSVPAARLEQVQQAAQSLDAATVAEVFRADSERIIGPAWLGYLEPADFQPIDPRGARRLNESDNRALNLLSQACTPTEWEHSAIEFGHPEVFGCFVGDELAAAGICRAQSQKRLDIGIVAHPKYRGQGYAHAVVSAMTEYGLADGRIMQYRTLEENTPSVVLARKLGYQQYASTLSVRFKS